jgi:hypothetical protein
MSKTVKELVTIVGGAALIAVGALTANPALEGIGVSMMLSGFGLALRQTPPPVGNDNSISFQTGVASRRVLYGHYQAAGVCTYASFPPSQNQSTTNQYLHLVYTLTDHEISCFDAIAIDGFIYNFVGDIQWDGSAGWWHLDPGSSGTASDFYWQHAFFEFDFGRNLNSQPFPQLAASDPSWTSACIQQGCAKVHVVLRADDGWPAVYPAGEIPNIQFLITGKKLIDPRVVTAWQESIGYLKYNWIADNFGVIWVQQNTSGTSGSSRPNFEANDSAGTTLSDGSLSWRSSGQNMTSISFGADANPQGHLVNGRLVNDSWAPGLGYGLNGIIEAPLGYLQQQTSSSGTVGATEPAFSTTLGGTTADGTQSWVCLGRSWHAINPSNPALAIYDYLQDTESGIGAAASTIDVASVIAAANVCEEQVLIIWNADNTVVYENLYACDGIFDHSSVRGNVLTSLKESMAGWVIPPGDLWHVFAGAYVTPTIPLTDSDMRGQIKGDFRITKREVANTISGKYSPRFLPANPPAAISLTQAPGTWQLQPFPDYQANGLAGKPDYLNSEDGGQVIRQQVQFDFTTSVWMAQRLAKITLMRLRFQQTLALQCKLTAFAIEAGDTFYFTHPRWQILGGVYQGSQCSISIESGQKDSAPVVGVDIVARQVDPSIYSFTAPSSSSDPGEYSSFGLTGIFSGTE